MNVQQFLRHRDIPFEIMQHQPTYTAQSLAQAVHVSGDEVAKTVLLRADEDYVLAVLPATHSVDLTMAKDLIGAGDVRLAQESECGSHFPDCELGVLPPFGSQYGMKTLVDESLMHDEEIVFEGNNHHEAIRMRLEDYQRLEHPLVGSFAHHL
jgi:Ala-tRNA(Pro) deacylase